jgi:hypothetical protein
LGAEACQRWQDSNMMGGSAKANDWLVTRKSSVPHFNS